MAKKRLDATALASILNMAEEEIEIAPQPAAKPAGKAKPAEVAPKAGAGEKPKKSATAKPVEKVGKAAEEQKQEQKETAAKAAVDEKRLDKPQEDELAVMMKLDEVYQHPRNRRTRPENKLIELAMNIHEVGLLEYPLAWVNAEGKCELLSGHNRYLAYKWLRDNVDAEKYAKIPIRFRKGLDSERKAMLILHSANFYNDELFPSERAASAAFIYEEAEIRRKEDKTLVGKRSADVAAQEIGTNARTVSRLVRIHRNLIDELKELWDKDVITQTWAEDLTKLHPDCQRKFYELAKDYAERLTKQQFASLQAKAVDKPAKKKAGRTKDPNKQLRVYVSGFVKKGQEVKEWRDQGGTVDQELLDELKAIVKMLEE